MTPVTQQTCVTSPFGFYPTDWDSVFSEVTFLCIVAFFTKEEPWQSRAYSQIYLQLLAVKSTSKKSFQPKSRRRAFVNLQMRIRCRCWAFCCVHIAVVVPDLWANIFIRGYPLILKSTLPLGQSAWTQSPGAAALWCCAVQQSNRKHMKDCKTL